MKINLGSGYKRIDGYINIDGDSNCKPDFLVDLEKDKLPFEDNSVDEILAHHILEHIGNGFFNLLKEIYRVCKNGAVINITVPHMNHDIFKIDPTHKRPLTVESFRMFSKKQNEEVIKNNGSSTTLAIINNVDFEVIENQYILDPFYQDILPNLQQEEIIRLGREANNVCIEEYILLRVIKTN